MLLFHSPLLSPSQGSKRLDPGWPTGKKGPSLLLAGDANTQETDRGIYIRGQYIYTIWNSRWRHFQVFES